MIKLLKLVFSCEGGAFPPEQVRSTKNGITIYYLTNWKVRSIRKKEEKTNTIIYN